MGFILKRKADWPRHMLSDDCCFASVGLGPGALATHKPRASALLADTGPLNTPMLLSLISHAGFGNSCSVSLSILGAIAVSGHVLRPVLPLLPACHHKGVT